MSQTEERVMTIPRWELENDRDHPLPDVGFRYDPKFFDRIMERGFVMYPRRSLVEQNSNCKHVAVYCIVWFKQNGERHYLTYQRGQKGEGEDRLASLWSLGVGGHVNRDDGHPEFAASREFAEEVPGMALAEDPFGFIPIGVINDESNAVGSVHLGALHSVRVKPFAASIEMIEVLSESPLRSPGFATADQIRSTLVGKMESWSEIVFREVIEKGLVAGS